MKTRLIGVMAICAALTGSALACFQVNYANARMRAHELKGRVTYNGKAVEDSRLVIYRAIAVTKERRWAIGPQYDPVALKIVVTDSEGRFSFGELTAGKYWIRMTSPSSEYFEVELVAPGKHEEVQQLWLQGYADWCTRATAEPAND